MINIPAAPSSYLACVDAQAYHAPASIPAVLGQDVVSAACVRACKLGWRGGATVPTHCSGEAGYPNGAGVDLLALRYVAHPEVSARVLAGGGGPLATGPCTRA